MCTIMQKHMAVLRTHFCADRTAIYGSFTDTFRLSEPKTHKTADLSSSTFTFRLSELIFKFGATELPYMAVLRTLYKTAAYGSCAQVFKWGVLY